MTWSWISLWKQTETTKQTTLIHSANLTSTNFPSSPSNLGAEAQRMIQMEALSGPNIAFCTVKSILYMTDIYYIIYTVSVQEPSFCGLKSFHVFTDVTRGRRRQWLMSGELRAFGTTWPAFDEGYMGTKLRNAEDTLNKNDKAHLEGGGLCVSGFSLS